MVVLTQNNFIASERLDLEDMTLLLSSIQLDSQFLLNGLVATSGYIVNGFKVASAIGNTNTVSIAAASSTLIKANNIGSDAFSFLSSPPSAPNLTASLIASSRNYVELTLTTVPGTPLTRNFWDPTANNGLGAEFLQEVNTVINLQAVLDVSTSGFTNDALHIPLAIIDTDGSNTIKAIFDTRNLIFRLGQFDNEGRNYAWSSQLEPTIAMVLTGVSGTFVAGETVTFTTPGPVTRATALVSSYNSGSSTLFVYQLSLTSLSSPIVGDTVTGGTSGATGTVSTALDSFTGADKDIANLAQLISAMQTEFKAIKGTPYWFNAAPASLTSLYNTIIALENFLDGIITANSADTSIPAPNIAWDGSNVSITDGSLTPSSADIIGFVRIFGLTENLSLARQDGTGGSVVIPLASDQVLYITLPSPPGNTTYSGTGAGATNYKVVSRSAYSATNQNFWLAYSNGTTLYVRGYGAIKTGQVVQLAQGPTSGTGTGTGLGDDLGTLLYLASFSDLFPTPPTVSGPINISAGFTSPGNYNPAFTYWTLNYDASKTLTGTGTDMNLSSNASYTVVAGDVIRFSNQVRRITAVISQSHFTIESAFSTNPSTSPCTVSQAVYTVDINNFADAGISIQASLGGTVNQILMDYDDNNTAGSTVIAEGVTPNVAYVASSDNTNFTSVTTRTTNITDEDNSLALPTTSTGLWLRFFANKSSGSGFVNLLRYKVFLHSQQPATNTGFALNQAAFFTDGTGTPINCQAPILIGGKTQTQLGFTYTPGINSGTENGQLLVTINGQKIPRFVSASATPDAYYTEVDNQTIRLDSDYSAYNFNVEVIRWIASVDVNPLNSANIALIEASKLRNYIINSNFRFNQRGGLLGTFGNPSSGIYNLDRWNYQYDGTPGTFVISQQAFTLGQGVVPDEPSYYWQLNQTVANSGSTFELSSQKIEGVRTLANKTATLSFWASADSARTLTVDFRQFFGTGGSPSSAVITPGASFGLTTGFQLFSVTVTLPSIFGKTLGTNVDDYLEVRFKTPLNTTKTINIAHVMLNEGNGVLPWISAGKEIEAELALCQRFYEKSYDVDIRPGTFPLEEPNSTRLFQSSPNAVRLPGYLKVTKRNSPNTIVAYSGVTGNNGVININGSDAAVTASFANTQGFWLENNTVDPTGDYTVQYFFAYDAELIS